MNDDQDKILDDEEKFIRELESGDIVEEDRAYAVTKEDDYFLAYKIEGIFKNEEKGVYLSPSQLKKEPPVLTVSDSNDNEVCFVLRKNFVDKLISGLTEVQRAYGGFKTSAKSPPIKVKDFPKFFQDLPDHIKNMSIRSILTIIAVIAIILIIIFGR